LRELHYNKKLIAALSVFLAFSVIIGTGLRMLSEARKELKLLKEQQIEMSHLKEEFATLRQKVDSVESKKHLANVTGIVQAVDEIFRPIGLKNKVKTVKTNGSKEIKEGFEEEAEIVLEKVTLNEMLNIFYRIENAPMILTIKKTTMKKSFDNPELLNISLVLSFLKAK